MTRISTVFLKLDIRNFNQILVRFILRTCGKETCYGDRPHRIGCLPHKEGETEREEGRKGKGGREEKDLSNIYSSITYIQ